MTIKLTDRQIKKLVILSVILLFIVSLILPAFYIMQKDYYEHFISIALYVNLSEQVTNCLGIHCLFFGWLGILFVGAFGTISWFANIFFIPILVTYYKNRSSSMIMSFIALALALSAYSVKDSLKLLEDMEGIGRDLTQEVVVWGIGFYCWLLVYIILAIVTSIQFLKTNYVDNK